MSREEIINILDDMKVKIDIPKAAITQINRNKALDMAISDMKRVEKLESTLKQSHDTKLAYYYECQKLKDKNKQLTDLLYEQTKNLDSLNLETERLEDGIEKVKEEIKHTDFDMMDYYDHTETIREMVLNVINKHLGGKK